jgi:hypothetical protein
MHRRSFVTFLPLAVALMSLGPVAAQSTPPLRYALLSTVGDQMTVVYARTQTGSRLDRNDRESANLPDRALDRLVLRHLDSALKQTLPEAEVAALAAANESLLRTQREALMGRRPADAPVRAFADALPAGGADRLLLVLKHRAEARIPIDNGTIGLGRLEGVGFYVDRVTTLRAGMSGNMSPGFLAPFAYVRLVLADARGHVLAEREIAAAESHAMGDARNGLGPWDMMDPATKVDTLERLLQREIERELPRLLAAARQQQ